MGEEKEYYASPRFFPLRCTVSFIVSRFFHIAAVAVALIHEWGGFQVPAARGVAVVRIKFLEFRTSRSCALHQIKNSNDRWYGKNVHMGKRKRRRTPEKSRRLRRKGEKGKLKNVHILKRVLQIACNSPLRPLACSILLHEISVTPSPSSTHKQLVTL
jgi:hypothetical protein